MALKNVKICNSRGEKVRVQPEYQVVRAILIIFRI